VNDEQGPLAGKITAIVLSTVEHKLSIFHNFQQ